MWGYVCPDCDTYWESDQQDPGGQWCPCGAVTEPEQWKVPEDLVTQKGGWHNDIFDDLGWYNIENEAPEPTPPKFAFKSTQRCSVCGTVTGLHRFSFDAQGK